MSQRQYNNYKGNLRRELDQINKKASIVLEKIPPFNDSSSIFFEEKLVELSKRRVDVESGIKSVKDMIQEIKFDAVNKDAVMGALNKFADTFDHLKPHQQKDLLKLVLHKILLSEDKIKIGLYGQPSDKALYQICESGQRSQIPTWLPIVDSYRTFFLIPTKENIPLMKAASACNHMGIAHS